MKRTVTKLPALMLAMLLQWAPLLKVIPPSSKAIMASSPLAIVVRWGAAAAVAQGGYHAVSGATTVLITSPTNSVATNGVTYAYTITQSSANVDRGHTFTASPLPAGLMVTTIEGNNFPAIGRITGTPTEFGVWSVHLTATYFDNVDTLSAVPTNMMLTVYGKPIITNQPMSLLIAPGSNATFSVTAGGFPTPRYRWRHGTTNLTGRTNSTLSLTNVNASNAGGYSVVISNLVGSVTSIVATLTVQLPPPRFTLVRRLNGGVRMGFTRDPSATYEIVYSDSLPAAGWSTLTNWPPVAASTPTTVDVPISSPTTRFYQIRRSGP
jgi:hypothetical protein